jgi:hypothetical protein
MVGLVTIVAGILVVKAAGNDMGYVVFLAGIVIACRGAIALSQAGAKEIGN